MQKRKLVSVIVVFTLTVVLQRSSLTKAQSPTGDNNIPSDLILDLNLAKQNSAPDQKSILSAETKQALLTSTTGEATILDPKDTLAPQVKTEPAQNAVHSEQTTSEQVINIPETVEVNESGTPVPSSFESPQPTILEENNQAAPSDTTASQTSETPNPTDNTLVPGTNVTSPDDNAAPMDNSTNPNLPGPTTTDNYQNITNTTGSETNNITPTSEQTTPASTNPTDVNLQPTIDNSGQNIPLESQPESNPTVSDQSPTSTPATDNSQPSNPPSDNPPAGVDTSQPTTTDNTTVQGAETGPNLNILEKFLLKIGNFLGK